MPACIAKLVRLRLLPTAESCIGCTGVGRVVSRLAGGLRQVFACVDVEPQAMQGNGLDQTALQAGVDVECRGGKDWAVAGIEYRVNLAQGQICTVTATSTNTPASVAR